jgi:sugar phosphate isomerase/epimerase
MIYLSSLMALSEEPAFEETLHAFGNKVGVDVFSFTYSKEELPDLAKRIDVWRDHPLSFHGPMRNVEMTSAGESLEGRLLFENYARAFAFAGRFGGNSMVVHTHERNITKAEKPALQAQCINNLQTLVSMASKEGIALRVENVSLPHKGEPLFDEDEYIHLFGHLPKVQALIDIGHVHVTNWSLLNLLEKLKGRIGGFHLHNNDGLEDSHDWLCEGTMDMDHALFLIRKHAKSRDMVLEYGSMQGKTSRDLMRDVSRILQYQQ